MKRPDSPAILGLIGLAGLVIVGWIILTALGKTVPGEAWGLVLTLAGIVGGWVGKTLTSEPVEAPEPVAVHQLEPALFSAEPSAAVEPPEPDFDDVDAHIAGPDYVHPPGSNVDTTGLAPQS